MALTKYKRIFKARGICPIKMNNLSRLPDATGVYLISEIMNKEEVICYVGSTVSLRSRLNHHTVLNKLRAAGTKFSVYIVPMHYRHVRILERRLISGIKPRLNVYLLNYTHSSSSPTGSKTIIGGCHYSIVRVDKDYLKYRWKYDIVEGR